MLYELFMFWVLGSIGMVVASMILGGLLCACVPLAGSGKTRSFIGRNP